MKFSQSKNLSNTFAALLIGLLSLLFSTTAAAQLELNNDLLLDIEHKYGHAATQRLHEWQNLMQTVSTSPEQEQLKAVNDFFNQHIHFADDMDLWGVIDYWATPLELLARGAGDCEDYSIAKYFTLRALGIADNKMRITYVRSLQHNQAHMVVTYFKSSHAMPAVLDNLITDIKSAQDRDDLLPVYSFNGVGLWMAKSKGAGTYVGNSEGIERWSKLKQRVLSKIYFK